MKMPMQEQSVYIVESGSNENEEWIKYSDGKLKQSGTITLSDVNFDEAYGNVWIESTGVREINFPLNFKDDSYSIVLYGKRLSGGVGGVCGNTSDVSKVTYWLWQGKKYNFTGNNIIVCFEATGYWK